MLKKFSESDAVQIIKALAEAGLIRLNGPAKLGSDPYFNLGVATHDAIYIKALYFQLTNHASKFQGLSQLEEEARRADSGASYTAETKDNPKSRDV